MWRAVKREGWGDLCGCQGEGEREDEAGSQHPGDDPPILIQRPIQHQGPPEPLYSTHGRP